MRVTTPIYETILYILLINFTPTLYSLTLLYHLKSIKNPVSWVAGNGIGLNF